MHSLIVSIQASTGQSIPHRSSRLLAFAIVTLVIAVSLIAMTLFGQKANAAVLQEDRFDVLYHSYEGGGMSIDGPAILLRKKATETIAVQAYYYVDSISSASVDVMSTASPYEEERKEVQLAFEYLHDKTIIDMNLRRSAEDDFLGNSISLNISQDTFGDLTNISMGIAYGANEISRNGDEFFAEESKQYSLNFALSQILTRNLVMILNVAAIADEGYLNNPYRTVRYVDNSLPSGVGYQSEVYPNTRNSFSSKLSASYYLPYGAALFAHYRYFSDSWDIDAYDVGFAYRHPIAESFELEVDVRYYEQTEASFYSDLFPYKDAQNFLARDKELSAFNDITLGFSLTYMVPQQYSFGDLTSEASLQWDHLIFDYENFRDPTAGGGVGNEPFYGFSANVVRVLYSLYF